MTPARPGRVGPAGLAAEQPRQRGKWPWARCRGLTVALPLLSAQPGDLPDEVVGDGPGQRELQGAPLGPVRPEPALEGLVAGRRGVEADVPLPAREVQQGLAAQRDRRDVVADRLPGGGTASRIARRTCWRITW